MRALVVGSLAALSLACSSTGSPPVAPADAAPEVSTLSRTCARPSKVTAIPTTCNGSEALCAKRFDQVTVAMTHNAMSNAEDDFAPPNQSFGLARQLKDGVRGMMLDTHYYDVESDKTVSRMDGVDPLDQAYLCHSICQLGHKRMLDSLCDVVAFLDENRGEVLSIIFESNVTPADTETVLKAAGLTEYVYTHTGAWPTLRELIDSNKRLVVFTESDGGTPAWYHSAWSLIQDTPYSFAKASELNCSLNRGARTHGLFLLNHWVQDPLANPARAVEVNARDVLLARAQQCATEVGKTPNFVGVDFYELGDVMSVVKTLNGL